MPKRCFTKSPNYALDFHGKNNAEIVDCIFRFIAVISGIYIVF